MDVDFHSDRVVLRNMRRVIALVSLSLMLVIAASSLFFFNEPLPDRRQSQAIVTERTSTPVSVWQAPDSTMIPDSAEGQLIRYGKELISHTAKYLGPKGKVKPISNGMNCQNCHLKAGTKPFGNNYSAVASTYPKFRARSGAVESMEKRVNDCIERSLNGKKLDESSLEMRAIIAYFTWLGKDVAQGTTPNGAGITALPFMPRAADPLKGKAVYEKHCRLCHGPEGVGVKHRDSLEWTYPPLAGVESYNTGAGMLRLSRLAGYVRSNMPNGATYDKPVLSEEEAWDVAAYVNALPRPLKDVSADWPDLATKPFDHPFGPYADPFSEIQHKFGPFGPIRDAQKSRPVLP